jgi:hypothetical protein
MLIELWHWLVGGLGAIVLWQWLVGGLGALLIGMSKTWMPGLGMLAVSLLAVAFRGWASIGLVLPLLLFADIFAVSWYRRHAQWGMLVRLLPWVLTGLLLGACALHYFGTSARTKAMMSPIIGGVVLTMLILLILQMKLGERFVPHSTLSAAATGMAAGFSTTVANAAGPIMSIFLTAQKFPKEQFMGTIAWYFLLINACKVPVYLHQHMFTPTSLRFDLLLTPGVLLGVLLGRWLLPRINQQSFTVVILLLSAVSAVALFFIK